ncbi:MAG: sugar transferase [Acidobacteria bacterium]|nr:sugar transferase [Acidobacteriota bacterium]
MTIITLGAGVLGLMTQLARRYFFLAKEVVDIVLGFVALVLSLPILAACILIVKLSSKGPAIFKQTRMGQDGKPFEMCKLRTMYTDAEAASGAVWATAEDPRVVPTCRWMRRAHIDELPQLLNVIKGEMSLVGPRPERPEILAELEKTYPHVRRRLAVRPGITGLAQVRNGYDTSIEAFRHKLAADLEYVERSNWSTEIGILAATFAKFHDRKAR